MGAVTYLLVGLFFYFIRTDELGKVEGTSMCELPYLILTSNVQEREIKKSMGSPHLIILLCYSYEPMYICMVSHAYRLPYVQIFL